MSDLVAFLLARLDEDEQVARAAASPEDRPSAGVWTRDCDHAGWSDEPLPPGHDDCCGVRGDDIYIYDEGGHDSDQAEHIARHDPARVLAEVEAKRQIIDLHAEEHECPVQENTGHSGSSRTVLVAPGYIYADDPTLRLLALPYASHPDYREEWKP